MTALILKIVITAYLWALFNPLYTMPSTSAYCSTLINFAIVIYFNCKKDNYFALSCPELKDINDIKEIKEKEIFKKLRKKEF